MNDDGKSDKPIVPKKDPNNGGGRPRRAEGLEGKGLAKGNPGEQTRFWTQGQVDLQHALERIRKGERLASLPKAGARCGSAARRDLCGGWPARVIPTATSHRLFRVQDILFIGGVRFLSKIEEMRGRGM